MSSGAGESTGSGASGASRLPTWLMQAKVTAPELPRNYVPREPLRQRLDGCMQRRLTVLRAPAGFAKTTVLTDIARDTQEQGRIVAWVSLDDDDTPEVFGSYLACAFERAGLDLGIPTAQDAWSGAPAAHQVGMLARAIEQHAAPCLLVLDEIDQTPPRTVHLIDTLLKRAPRNLHVVLTCRSNPGLDVASHLLAGEAVLVGAEALRFSTAEIARFFGGELSRRELAEVEERTAGWPVALMVHRNMRSGAAAGLGADAATFTENYIGVRLLRGLSPEDRGCLLDLAVFDWIEADLVDDVLGSSQARVRITGLPALDGLLLPVGKDRTTQRLHPLLREHCLALLEAEDLPRKCSLHERLARALVRRGDLTQAWRHAREAGDRRLVGDLIERFGAYQLWLRGGAMELSTAGRYLTPEITESHPRLELLRCIYLRLSSRHQEAEALFESVARQTGGFARDRGGGDDDALAADSLLARAMLAGAAAAPPDGAPEPVLPVGASAPAGGAISRSVASARHVWLCVACHERADFEESRRHGLQAQQRFSGNARFGRIFVDIYRGMSAMAQGRVAEATASYARARQGIRNFFPSDPYLTMSIDVLKMEINFERGRTPAFPRRTLMGLSTLREVWADIHIAALGVSAGLTFEQHDGDAVIERLTEVVDDVRAKGLAILSSNLSALLAYYLVEAGRPGEAGQVWRDHGLPCVASELLDLDRQSWRAMEALSCARVRLLAAQGECAAAEELASRLCSTAAERGLTRTRLRGLALSMVVADGAGRPHRAQARLVEFLRLVAEVDYVRPMVRHREVSRRVLKQLLDTDLEEDVQRAAESLLAQVDAPVIDNSGIFTPREVQVLREVQWGHSNQEVGNRLGMTMDGVRYHLKSIYRKTGASSRTGAVRYALAAGVLS